MTTLLRCGCQPLLTYPLSQFQAVHCTLECTRKRRHGQQQHTSWRAARKGASSITAPLRASRVHKEGQSGLADPYLQPEQIVFHTYAFKKEQSVLSHRQCPTDSGSGTLVQESKACSLNITGAKVAAGSYISARNKACSTHMRSRRSKACFLSDSATGTLVQRSKACSPPLVKWAKTALAIRHVTPRFTSH